jgi:hypothetical protein
MSSSTSSSDLLLLFSDPAGGEVEQAEGVVEQDEPERVVGKQVEGELERAAVELAEAEGEPD